MRFWINFIFQIISLNIFRKKLLLLSLLKYGKSDVTSRNLSTEPMVLLYREFEEILSKLMLIKFRSQIALAQLQISQGLESNKYIPSGMKERAEGPNILHFWCGENCPLNFMEYQKVVDTLTAGGYWKDYFPCEILMRLVLKWSGHFGSR